MIHFPVDHRLRSLHRALAGLVGLASLVLGGIGLARTSGIGVFRHHDLPRVFGLHMNPAFAVVSVLFGAVVFGAALVGRNVDHRVNLGAGVVYLVAGLVLLTVMQTDANLFGFSMGNCIVSFVLGLVTLTAGLYGKRSDTTPARR